MDYSSISSTAHVIAFIRPSARIRYGQEIASASNAEAATKRFYHRDDFDVDITRMVELAPWIRLRFMARQRFARGSGIPLVFEVASGLSPAGLIESSEHVWRYRETDLPEMISYKQEVVRKVTGGQVPKKLSFAPLNPLEPGALKAAVLDFNPDGPILITCEGLLQYLTREEKHLLAKQIAPVLRDHGGMWVTTDICYAKDFERGYGKNDYSRRIREIMCENTGRDMIECAFENSDDARDLMQEAGLKPDRYTQLSLAGSMLNASDVEKHKNLAHQELWAMRSF